MTMEDLMRECFQTMEYRTPQLGVPQLIMVIKRDRNKCSYTEIKRVSDTILRIPSQCIVTKHVN